MVASPAKIRGQSLKAMLVMMMIEPCSYRLVVALKGQLCALASQLSK
jgi:hypothetical protein